MKVYLICMFKVMNVLNFYDKVIGKVNLNRVLVMKKILDYIFFYVSFVENKRK